jgi:hypothetical protein
MAETFIVCERIKGTQQLKAGRKVIFPAEGSKP